LALIFGRQREIFGLIVAHWLPPFVAVAHKRFFSGNAKRKTFAGRDQLSDGLTVAGR